jgi:hypothetical protein
MGEKAGAKSAAEMSNYMQIGMPGAASNLFATQH